jgi:hypothetical protein
VRDIIWRDIICGLAGASDTHASQPLIGLSEDQISRVSENFQSRFNASILHEQLHTPRSAFHTRRDTTTFDGTPAASNAILARSASTRVEFVLMVFISIAPHGRTDP